MVTVLSYDDLYILIEGNEKAQKTLHGKLSKFAAQDLGDVYLLRLAWANQQAGAARRFYEKLDFLPSPADPLHLFVLL